MPNADLLNKWVVAEILALYARHKAQLATNGGPKIFPTSTYLPGTVDAMCRSGFVVPSPTLVGHFLINPDVTEEQWEGLEVYFAIATGA